MWKLVIYIHVYNLFVCAELHLPLFPNQSSMCFSRSQFASSLATIPSFIIGKFCGFIPFFEVNYKQVMKHIIYQRLQRTTGDLGQELAIYFPSFSVTVNKMHHSLHYQSSVSYTATLTVSLSTVVNLALQRA